jgi:hypothetical protein
LDLRRPLFQLEQWSPTLAKRIWGLASIFEAPLTVALGLKVRSLNDLHSEIEVPLNRFTRNESGEIQSSVILAAGEFASKVLWQRHLNPDLEVMRLDSIHCRFLRPALTAAKARTELAEPEREKILRRLKSGEEADCEMSVVFVDHKDQQVAALNCVWRLRPQRRLALGQGVTKTRM